MIEAIMLSFMGFLLEGYLNSKAGNPDNFELRGNKYETEGDRHTQKYIAQYLPGRSAHAEGTHTVNADVSPEIPKGSAVTIHGHAIINGKHHAVISASGSNKKVTVPTNRLNKPRDAAPTENEGHRYEKSTFDRFREHGLVPEGFKPAGSTAGTDVPILNKRKNTQHSGKILSDDKVLLSGEVKKDTTAAFGQITVRHDPAKGGWHIPDDNRGKRPKYAAAVEAAGLLDHLNKTVPNPSAVQTTASGRAKTERFPHPNLEPAESYLSDHHVDVLHVGGGHGTYSVGKKDVTGHGLPRLSGKGLWTIRQKQTGANAHNARTIMFQPHGKGGLNNSHINLDNDDHMESFKKTLGHNSGPALDPRKE